MFIRKIIAGPLLACTLLFSTASAQPDTSYIPCSAMPELMQSLYADFMALDRIYTVDNAPDRRERISHTCAHYLDQLKNIPFNSLTQGCKADYLMVQRDLESTLHDLQTEQREFDALKSWFPFADSIYAVEKRRRRGATPDSRSLAGQWYAMSLDIVKLNNQLASGSKITVMLNRRAQAIIGGLQAALKSVYRFYNGYDPLFTWWIPDTYKKLDSNLSVYAQTFASAAEKNAPNKDSSGIIGQPIGRDEVVRQLKEEMIDYSPEELIEIANKEFAWCDAEMLKVSQEMGFGNDWKKALEQVKNTYVPAGEQPAAMMKLYNESIAFIKANDMITIPPLAEETWRMVMMSPQQQLLNPFFYGGEEFSISYPTNTMDYADRMMSMRGNNPHFSRATVHHELIAGHYLQQFMCEHYKTYRHYFSPFWTEGWALYWEMILWDHHFPQSPEDKAGMLFWRMHRCARIIFSLNYHMGKWNAQQCIDFLVDRVGHERANAAGEVRRSFSGGYGPLYQLAYMIGGLEFYALKKELVDSGKMTLKQYHDAVMHENNMPVKMVRAIISNQPLHESGAEVWKFYKLP